MFGVGAADLARNAPQCGPQNPTACMLMGLDILSMAGALMSMMGNQESNEATDTEAPPAPTAGGAGGGSGAGAGGGSIPGLGDIKSAMATLCQKAPSACKSCATKPDDPTCVQLVVPDAFDDGLAKFIDQYQNDGLADLPLPQNLQEDGALEEALGNIADLPNALASLNSSLESLPTDTNDVQNAKENLAVDEEDLSVSKPLIAKLKKLPDLSSLLDRFRKTNGPVTPVKFVGLDVEDLKTGKRLTLFDRAKRRYRGTADYPRSFTLARMEMMRSRAIAEKIKINRSIEKKKAQALALSKKAPNKH